MLNQRKEIATMGNQVLVRHRFSICFFRFVSFRSLSFCIIYKFSVMLFSFVCVVVALLLLLGRRRHVQMQCKICAFCGFSIYFASIQPECQWIYYFQ